MGAQGSERSVWELMRFYELRQCNGLRNAGDGILDLILSNLPCRVHRDMSPFLKEDKYHPALMCHLNLGSDSCVRFSRSSNFGAFNFHKIDMATLCEDLLSEQFIVRQDCPRSINFLVNDFYKKLYNAIRKSVPVYRKQNRRYPTWYNKEIIDAVKSKNRMHKKFIRTRNDLYLDLYRELRRSVKAKMRSAYREYLDSSENSFEKEPNKFWSFTWRHVLPR
ncbi:hypothetical protein HHI36_021757 [Cryptolaemus montrouzieri]|uniref:Uncharacterized protein n=1 Tax=Cryptolaemus montrouzieri TaxID=559131 RepID=A0ABD2MXV7_9CUCU